MRAGIALEAIALARVGPWKRVRAFPNTAHASLAPPQNWKPQAFPRLCLGGRGQADPRKLLSCCADPIPLPPAAGRDITSSPAMGLQYPAWRRETLTLLQPGSGAGRAARLHPQGPPEPARLQSHKPPKAGPLAQRLPPPRESRAEPGAGALRTADSQGGGQGDTTKAGPTPSLPQRLWGSRMHAQVSQKGTVAMRPATRFCSDSSSPAAEKPPSHTLPFPLPQLPGWAGQGLPSQGTKPASCRVLGAGAQHLPCPSAPV